MKTFCIITVLILIFSSCSIIDDGDITDKPITELINIHVLAQRDYSNILGVTKIDDNTYVLKSEKVNVFHFQSEPIVESVYIIENNRITTITHFGRSGEQVRSSTFNYSDDKLVGRTIEFHNAITINESFTYTERGTLLRYERILNKEGTEYKSWLQEDKPGEFSGERSFENEGKYYSVPVLFNTRNDENNYRSYTMDEYWGTLTEDKFIIQEDTVDILSSNQIEYDDYFIDGGLSTNLRFTAFNYSVLIDEFYSQELFLLSSHVAINGNISNIIVHFDFMFESTASGAIDNEDNYIYNQRNYLTEYQYK